MPNTECTPEKAAAETMGQTVRLLACQSIVHSKVTQRPLDHLQAAGFAVGVHISQQVDAVQQSIAALQAQGNAQMAATDRVLQMVDQLTAQGRLPDALKVQ